MKTQAIARSVGMAAATVAVVTATALGAVYSQQPAPRSGLIFERDLPAMDGKHLNLKVVDVRVAPGASSAPHKHGCAVVVYVIKGAMRMQVRGGRDSVYRSGETFHERPDDIHQVSANASAADSAHFTATFVCDHVGPLTTPANDSP
jgi:quercetin dioxygenase-like cupin family protein